MTEGEPTPNPNPNPNPEPNPAPQDDVLGQFKEIKEKRRRET